MMALKNKFTDFVFPTDVQGWLSPEEGRLLFELAQANPHLGAVMELGCFHGRSTICLAQGSRKIGGGRVITVDNFVGDRSMGFVADFSEDFKRNIKRYKLEKEIIALRGNTIEAAKKWARPIRFLFIDAGHFYDEVLQDYQSWKKFVVPGGIIAFHDSEWAGVNKVLSRLIKSGRLKEIKTYQGPGSTGLTYGVKVGSNESVIWWKRYQSWLKFKLIFLPGYWSRFKQGINQREETDFWFKFFGFLNNFLKRLKRVGGKMDGGSILTAHTDLDASRK